MQPPPAAVMKPAAATESLGTMGTEYPPPNHGRPRRTTKSADSRGSDLGAENRDARSRSPFSSEDTLVFSPELAGARQPAKREARTRTSSAKKRYMPMASSPPAKLVLRRPSSSPGGPQRPNAWQSPRNRVPQLAEERIDRVEKALAEHTKMGLELRRELFAKFGELQAQTRATEAKLAGMEAILGAKFDEINEYTKGVDATFAGMGVTLDAKIATIEAELVNIMKFG